LMPLRVLDWLMIVVVVVAWAFLLRFAWRARIFQRLLEIDIRL
jgi:hypothetical protein